MSNTFNQLDQYEATKLTVGKTKHVYDFSHSSLNEGPPAASQVHSVWMIKGKINQENPAGTTSVAGDTGVRPIIFGDPATSNRYSSIYTGITVSGGLAQYSTLTSTINLVADNSNEKTVPYLESNALVYLPGNKSSFRTGYIEISFKTNKQNCILGYGSEIMTYANAVIGKTIADPYVLNISGTGYTTEDLASSISELSINIKNGKLNLSYQDNYGNNATAFEITGNKTVADDVWHHVVVNLGRPGLAKDHTTTFENKSIEFWIDGKLDKRTEEYVNDSQIFFPEITWLAANPKKLYNGNFTQAFFDGFNSQDDNFFATNQTAANLWNGVWNESALTDAFTGAIRTFAHGINFPLNKFEVQERFKFWNYDEFPFRDALTATATIVQPTVSVNKKRALKLFWNDIENKNGIELDNNYIVNSYSVTHKNKNSSTETFNLDLASKKTSRILTNVRVALKDNVTLWGPGTVPITNRATILTTTNAAQINPNKPTDFGSTVLPTFAGSIFGLTFSGVELNDKDRVLLTNQINPRENGIWVYNGQTSPMTRPSDVDAPTELNNAVVYVTAGKYAETYWALETNVGSFSDSQKWIKLENKPEETLSIQPLFTGRWSDENGQERFIDLQSDININNYDLIVFKNYPETFAEIKDSFSSSNAINVKQKYDNFINSLRNIVAQGASLYISSPLLALDLGVISDFNAVDQAIETSDAQAAAISPFESQEAANQYFDTHRINQYRLATEVAGLTNKATYILTDFINYVPTDTSGVEQYHAKYVNKPLGIKEGNEFFIPSLTIRKNTENTNLPGYSANRKGSKPMIVLEPHHVNTGTTVTKLQNTYYVGSTAVVNPYDDNITTLIVHNGQLLKGQPVNGKIFLNLVEDGYTMSRQDYNKAVIQVLPTPDINETTATRAWNYSTTRLNRSPRKINIRGLTEYGQTTPTNGGGGPLIQAPSNSSNGIIRSATDKNNVNYQSDLYATVEEEKYAIQEIPVLSMTWLGLQWLAE